MHPTQLFLIYVHSGCFCIMIDLLYETLLEVITSIESQKKQTDTQIWNFAFIYAPSKTLTCGVGGGWQPIKFSCKRCNEFLIYLYFTISGLRAPQAYP